MSTILDALRKLQRDRESQQVSRDLRQAVIGEIPQSESESRRGVLPWLLMVLLVAAGGTGVWLLGTGTLGPEGESLAARAPGADVPQELADGPRVAKATAKAPTPGTDAARSKTWNTYRCRRAGTN